MTQRVLNATPTELPTLAVSTTQEWDDYEWSWTGSLTHWALHDAADDQERDQALAIAREHRDGWLNGYRGELGFCTLVLQRTVS